jgi:hypothetical protein
MLKGEDLPVRKDSVVTDKVGDPIYWLMTDKIKTIPEWLLEPETVYIDKAAELVDDQDTHNIPYAYNLLLPTIWKRSWRRTGRK